MLTDYLNLLFDEFVELHGDKFFGDDRAMPHRLRQARSLQGARRRPLQRQNAQRTQRVLLRLRPSRRLSQSDVEDAHWPPSISLPIICLIDTPGAYPGIGAEERGQAQVIAQSMLEMSRLPTPIICVVIGEGGSGGALGIGVGDRVAVLAVRLLLGDQSRRLRRHPLEKPRLRQRRRPALKLTSKYLHDLGCVDDVIEEPLGAAHRDHHQMATRLKMYLLKSLRELVDMPTDKLLAARYDKFRRMGQFLEGDAAGPEPVNGKPS